MTPVEAMALYRKTYETCGIRKSLISHPKVYKQGEGSGKSTLISKAIDQAVHLPVEYIQAKAVTPK